MIMPDLDQRFFRGSEEIPRERVPKLVTGKSEKDIEDSLTKLGWEGQLVATIVLRVTPDGSQTDSGSFMLRGALTPEPIKIQAAKLWEKATADVILAVNAPNGADFMFAGGRLCSDYVSCEKIGFQFVKAGELLAETEWERNGVGKFCVRLLAHLGKTSNGAAGPHIKFTLLTHPLDVDNLLEVSAAAQGPAWPGIKALEGQCGFFPVVPGGLWAAPCFPLIDVHQRASTCDKLPEGRQLLFAMAAVMRTATRPTACTSFNGLKRQVDKVKRDLEAAASPTLPTITWPEARRPNVQRGRRAVILSSSFSGECG